MGRHSRKNAHGKKRAIDSDEHDVATALSSMRNATTCALPRRDDQWTGPYSRSLPASPAQSIPGSPRIQSSLPRKRTTLENTSDSDKSWTKQPTPLPDLTDDWWQQRITNLAPVAQGKNAFALERVRNLRHCLVWLQYAVAHIEHNIAALRDVISEIKRNKDQLIASKLRRVAFLKVNILSTLQAVIHVASEYTRAALPEQAVGLVKKYILDLPLGWLARNPTRDAIGSLDDLKIKTEAHVNQLGSTVSEEWSTDCHIPPNIYEDVCRKTETVLTFATDSLTMIQNVARVFYSVVGRVDNWLDSFNVLPGNTQQETDFSNTSCEPPKSRRKTEVPRTCP